MSGVEVVWNDTGKGRNYKAEKQEGLVIASNIHRDARDYDAKIRDILYRNFEILIIWVVATSDVDCFLFISIGMLEEPLFRGHKQPNYNPTDNSPDKHRKKNSTNNNT